MPIGLSQLGAAKGTTEADDRESAHWLTPVANRDELPSVECLRAWLACEMWGFNFGNQLRDKIRANDWIAFYCSEVGVVAFARCTETPRDLVLPGDWPEPTPYRDGVVRIRLAQISWLSEPVTIPPLIGRLEAFVGKRKGAIRTWAWLVNSTRRVSAADFTLLTGGSLLQ